MKRCKASHTVTSFLNLYPNHMYSEMSLCLHLSMCSDLHHNQEIPHLLHTSNHSMDHKRILVNDLSPVYKHCYIHFHPSLDIPYVFDGVEQFLTINQRLYHSV